MTEMIDAIDNESTAGWGDLLQAPQRWCYREWQHLTFAEASLPELAATIAKVCILLVVTPPSLAFGFVGSVIKFCGKIMPDDNSILISAGSGIIINGKYYGNEVRGKQFHVNNNPVIRQGSGIVAEKTYRFDHPVQAVDLNVGDLEIVQGDENSLVVTADDNILDLLKPMLESDKVTLGVQNDIHLITDHDIKYRLTIPHLRKLSISGAGDVMIPYLNSSDFKCKISGASKVSVSQGYVSDQVVHISGSGTYSAPHLITNHTNVSISGVGKAKICAQKTLDVDISGIGSCTYYGYHPLITESISGIGSVESHFVPHA